MNMPGNADIEKDEVERRRVLALTGWICRPLASENQQQSEAF